MAERKTTLEKKIGDTWFFPINAESDETTDFTKIKVYFTIKKNLDDADSDAVFQDSGLLDVNGKIVFTCPATITSKLHKGQFVYNMRAIETVSGSVMSTDNASFETTLSATKAIS